MLAEKDRYGFFNQTILCGKCGLLRTSPVLDEDSNRRFYANEYRSIYVGSQVPPESFFRDQVLRGQRLAKVFTGMVHDPLPGPVFEAGCGAGGILASFAVAGLNGSGCDFDENYLQYGRERGLELHRGDFCNIVEDQSVGLFLLSHVLEHFADPIGKTTDIIQKISPGGYLLVEVPGIFNMHKVYFDPILYLQGAHAYSYAAAHLHVFFTALGMEVIFGDERCIFLLRKPSEWHQKHIDSVYDSCLAILPGNVRRYFARTRLMHILHLNPFAWRQKVLMYILPARGKTPHEGN